MAVIYADANIATMALFGKPSKALNNYVNRTNQHFVNNVINVDFVNRAIEKRQSYDTGHIRRSLDAVISTASALWQPDSIRYLKTAEDIQNCPDQMRRWIMASPVVREMYLDGRLEGYQGEYINTQAAGIGHEHYDYLYATSGMMIPNKETKKVTMRRMGSSKKEDYSLTRIERVGIARTHNFIEKALSEGLIDITSKNNALIG